MYWYLPTYFSGVTMILRRHDLDLLTGGFYLPTGIFAILSMISYFIHPEVVPGRMGLLVTLFLISSNVYNSLKGPQNRGFSYIEVWLIGAHGTILLAIFEYGIILAWKQHSLVKMDPLHIDAIIKKIGMYVLFSSNHNVHKSSYGLCFWASDPLIERF